VLTFFIDFSPEKVCCAYCNHKHK